MANRIIQFKRNQNLAGNAVEAKSKIKALTLQNGEIVIGTYATSSNEDGSAKIIGVKANDKIFNIDNQTILDTIGIDDNGNVNPLVTGNTILKSIDSIETNVSTISGDLDTLEDVVDGLITGSSEISGNVAVLSAKTVTTVEDSNSVDLTISNASDGTKKVKADVKISTSGSAANNNANIIKETSTGLYASVDYNTAENALYVNGIKKPLNAGSIVDSITYDSTTEEIIITYHSTTSSTPQTVRVNVKDLIEEFEFPATDSEHNVSFTQTRVVGGKSKIQANISVYDCGEY